MPLSPDELINAGVSRSLISLEQLETLRLEALRRRQPLVDLAAQKARCPVSMFYCALAEQRGLPFVDLATVKLDLQLIRRLPDALLMARLVLPVAEDGDHVLVATADPDDSVSLQNVQRMLRRPLRVALADPDSLRETIRGILAGRRGSSASHHEDPIAICERILQQAYLRRASDVHLESMPEGLRVRFRVDGRLQSFPMRIDRELAMRVISRMKVLAGLDISEQRAPQDGRFEFTPAGRDDAIDVRMASIPTRFGERITMRLLDATTTQLALDSIGMAPETLARFRKLIQQPHGVVLLAGPTGSGKTSTLYAALRELNERHRNIMTVEDPVEYVVPGLSQIPIDSADKMTFAKALRSLLRHDPDVLMIGEIRDGETAEIALQAALTGHFVFSTIHANSAASAVTRLVEMGCPEHMVAATMRGVVSQRLVRRLCENCKTSRRPTDRERTWLGNHGGAICDPVGCARCLGIGYRGRIGLFETLWIDRTVRSLIQGQASEDDIEAQAGRQLTNLRADAVAKVQAGLTTLEEVLSVLEVGMEDDLPLLDPESEALEQVRDLRHEIYSALQGNELPTHVARPEPVGWGA